MQNSAANIAHVHRQLLQSHLAKQFIVHYLLDPGNAADSLGMLLIPWGCC